MLSFLRKKNNSDTKNNWRFVQTDIHSHILPGIDDGAQTIEDSIALITSMQQHGYKKMVATPHISEDIYPNTPEIILRQRDLVRKVLAEKKIEMEIDAAAEYMIDEKFISLIEGDQRLLTIHDNYVLVEMSYLIESPYLHTALFALQTHGYRPILAHPERYNFYHDKPEKYDELKEKGCLFQLNTIAFSGYYGKNVKKTAGYLLSKKMYNYCGSDIHHLRHTQALHSVLESKVIYELQQYSFANKSF